MSSPAVLTPPDFPVDRLQRSEVLAELAAALAAELGLFEGVNLAERELAGARVAGEAPLPMTRALNVLGSWARARGEPRRGLLCAG